MTKLTEFHPLQENPNAGTPAGLKALEESVEQNGIFDGMTVAADGTVLSGNKRQEVLVGKGLDDAIIVETDGTKPVVIKRTDVPSAEDPKGQRIILAANQVHQVSYAPDEKVILSMLAREKERSGSVKGTGYTERDLRELAAKHGADQPAPEVPDDAGLELLAKWGVTPGDVWIIPSKSTPSGEHRLVCGDCTDAATLWQVMRGGKAVLVFADPPYGMGKEKEGIANDNLYREKLDAFQMAWWKAARPHVEDNGSAYIWGTAEDLWRLWYCGGLRDSERITVRNEIVWAKGNGQGSNAEDFRSYAPETERALFFMLGEQGFNNNADNYWDGWDKIVDYLEASRKSCGWSIKDTKRIAGHSENSGCHWFDKSQWMFPTQEVYQAWQNAAREYDGFKREYDELKREYDELKREFYSTRAYFDNTHQTMTDVWQFQRVQGAERWDHATPKPIELVERAAKSSAQSGAIVLDPFIGSGTTLLACERTGRLGRGCEISPKYCAVTLERLALAGLEPRRSDTDA